MSEKQRGANRVSNRQANYFLCRLWIQRICLQCCGSIG